MSADWYQDKGFDEDPLVSDPFRHSFEPLNLESEIEEVLYKVSSGSMCMVVGPEGSGKTALLKKVIDNFRGEGKVIYFDGKRINKRLDIEQLLIKGNGLRGSLLGKKPKGMILLLDNVHSLSKRNSKLIKFYFDQDFLKSVVFTTNDQDVLEDSIMSRIGTSIIRLSSLSEKDAIKLVESRLGEDVVSEKLVKDIYSVSGKDASKLLVSLDLVLKSGIESPTKEELKELLENDGVADVDSVCDSCSSDLVEVNGFWRCQNCDKYCQNCGILEDEEQCRNCKTIKIEVEQK
jgi:replication-associated recombination protein RarA